MALDVLTNLAKIDSSGLTTIAKANTTSGLMKSVDPQKISWLQKMNKMYGGNFQDAFNTTMGALGYGNTTESNNVNGEKEKNPNSLGNRIFDIGSNFASGFANGGGFAGGLKGSAGGLAALGGDLVAKWGQKSAVSKYGENINSDQNNVRSAIRQGIASFGPIGWAVAAGTGVVDAIGAATGTELSNIDRNAAKRAGVKGVGVQNTLNYLPGVSTLAGATGWALGVDRTSSFGMSDEAEAMAPGYAGTVNDLRAAEQLGNKRFLLGKQARKAQGFVDDAIANNQLLAQLNVTNTMRKNSDYYQDLAHQNINRYAGENYLSMRMGREGLKLMPAEEIRAILAKRKTEKLQNGGTIGIDTNILPEGSLHARLNHLDELNPELEDATKKGIPVMAADSGEVGQQIAEIERDELILRLEVTKRLEELMQDGSEDAMIEAGKLLTDEIIDNTQDNTGQITEEVEDGE